MKKIFANKERRKVLDVCGIEYKIDQNLNFWFESESEMKKAIKVLKAALEL